MNDEQRTALAAEDALGDRPERPPLEGALSATSHDDQTGVMALGGENELFRGVSNLGLRRQRGPVLGYHYRSDPRFPADFITAGSAREIVTEVRGRVKEAGADAIIALRCCKLSGRFEDFWERRSAAARAEAPGAQ